MKNKETEKLILAVAGSCENTTVTNLINSGIVHEVDIACALLYLRRDITIDDWKEARNQAQGQTPLLEPSIEVMTSSGESKVIILSRADVSMGRTEL